MLLFIVTTALNKKSETDREGVWLGVSLFRFSTVFRFSVESLTDSACDTNATRQRDWDETGGAAHAPRVYAAAAAATAAAAASGAVVQQPLLSSKMRITMTRAAIVFTRHVRALQDVFEGEDQG